VNHLKRLAGQFRCYPFWSQLLITIGSVLVLVMIWSACGAGNRSPSFPPPIEKPRLELPSRNGPVLALAFSPSGNNLASGTSDRVARIWDPSKGVVIQAMKGHLGIVTCIAFSSDGRILVTGSTDKTIKLWDIAKGREIRTLAGHTGAIRSIAFSTDGRWLASTGDDRRISLWSIDSGEELRVLERHQDPVNAVAFSPDGNVLASASNDKTVRLWDPATGRLLRTLYGHNSRVLSVAFSPDGKLLASGGAAQVDLGPRTRTGQLILWNPLTGEEEYVFQTTFGDVRSLTFSPDNRVLANSDGFGDFTVVTSWEVSTRTLRSKWTAHRGNINTLTYSPDGQWLASGGDDGRIRLWQ